jgi:hypothetical protein
VFARVQPRLRRTRPERFSVRDGLLPDREGFTRFRGCIVLGSTGNVADPQSAHEFEAWQPAQIVGVPFPEGRVLRSLADDRVLHDSVAEAVDHCCDGECATEPVVKTRFRQFLPPRRFRRFPGSVPTGFIRGSCDRWEDITHYALLRRAAPDRGDRPFRVPRGFRRAWQRYAAEASGRSSSGTNTPPRQRSASHRLPAQRRMR